MEYYTVILQVDKKKKKDKQKKPTPVSEKSRPLWQTLHHNLWRYFIRGRNCLPL